MVAKIEKTLKSLGLIKLLILFSSTLFFIFLMISFAFPDLFALFYVPNMLFGGNIYSQVIAKKDICLWLDATYPPLYYLTVGVYLKIIQLIGLLPGYLFLQNQCPVWNLILDRQFLFWAKFPYLITHFLAAWIFSRFFSQRRFLFFLLWLLNPIAIFVSFIFGQFEIFSAFFILFSLYLAQKRQNLLAFLSLGIGAAFKNFPFLLVVPFYYYLTRNLKERVVSTMLLVVPYLFGLALLLNEDYLKFVTFSENTKMLSLGFSLGQAKISIYIVLFLILTLSLVREKKKDFQGLVKYTFLFSLIYFITSFWSPQRFLFLIPTLLLISTEKKDIFKLLPLTSLLYFAYVFFVHMGFYDHTLLRPIVKTIVPYQYGLGLSSLPRIISASLMLGMFIWLGFLALVGQTGEVRIGRRDILKNFVPFLIYLGVIIFFLFYSGSLG